MSCTYCGSTEHSKHCGCGRALGGEETVCVECWDIIQKTPDIVTVPNAPETKERVIAPDPNPCKWFDLPDKLFDAIPIVYSQLWKEPLAAPRQYWHAPVDVDD